MRARIGAFGVVLLLFTVFVSAQTGSIAGVARDMSGAVLPGVTVEATSPALIEKIRSVVTDANGRYQITTLPVGTYEITFTLQGFATVKRANVVVTSDVIANVNVEMKIGATKETVNVTAEAPVVNVQNARMQQVFNGSEISQLPTQRNLPGLATGFSLSGSLGEAQCRSGAFCNPTAPPNTESYSAIVENAFRRVADEPLSTFSIDVDTASYANVRRFLNEGRLPPPDAVRIEEMVNYFRFAYPQPKGDVPFSVTTELVESPWNAKHRLVLVGLQGREIADADLAPRNLVFLIDVSGSMNSPDKLPLVRNGMRMLVEALGPRDRVAIVVYAGSSGLVLPSTVGDQKATIHEAIARLQAGGSTNGGAGIKLAYQVAREQFIKGGVNRVILATDGDFNVGVTNQQELVRLIEAERESGTFLSVLGVGTGNLKDSTMEMLADKGNGNYAYLDSLQEARKVLVREAGGTLVTIAKDVKIQVEFNPQTVSAYRLIGYENRLLENQDFNDDRKDAGEIGSGHSVTALYEIVPVGVDVPSPGVDALKYQQVAPPARVATPAAYSDELMTVKLRYKAPDGDTSRLVSTVVRKRPQPMTSNIGFASAVAELGQLLRGSQYRGTASFAGAAARARKFRGDDAEGYRTEFIKLAELASSVAALNGGTLQSQR
jgi:Ca-activated chloride channel family protein